MLCALRLLNHRLNTLSELRGWIRLRYFSLFLSRRLNRIFRFFNSRLFWLFNSDLFRFFNNDLFRLFLNSLLCRDGCYRGSLLTWCRLHGGLHFCYFAVTFISWVLWRGRRLSGAFTLFSLSFFIITVFIITIIQRNSSFITTVLASRSCWPCCPSRWQEYMLRSLLLVYFLH